MNGNNKMTSFLASERVVKVVVKKKEMVLSTTFALAQRHERERNTTREGNGHRKIAFGSQSERCMQRSCVMCPQADVPCTVGALFVAKLRYHPRAGR